MKKALISPAEDIIDSNTGVVLGVRIAEVNSTTFEVAEPLYWIDCGDEVDATDYYYNTDTNQCVLIPEQVPTAEENEASAKALLQETDWATIPVVADPTKSNPYLTNQDAFISYRSNIRQYAITPTSGNLNWGTMPDAVWSE